MTPLRSFKAATLSLFAATLALPLAAGHASAQQYSYLPSASTTDGRFLSIAGGSIQTLGDNVLRFKLASPAYAMSVDIGVFDGDTYGIYDQGSVPLIYTLFADPEGDGSGTMVLGQWSGDQMPDNDWFTATTINSPAARCFCGDYFYRLEVRSSDASTFQWSSFKLRTDGTIAINQGSSVTFSAPMGSALDAAVIYPEWPAVTPTTYDGTWRFWMASPTAVNALAIWDGDFDHGSYDCSDNDTDDPDTPNTSIPAWASGAAVAEGTAQSSIGCADAAGNPLGGYVTGNPPDDSRNPVFSRSPGISYDVVAPDGNHYFNDNPSGNLEWEQFMIDTRPFNRAAMDYHAKALPAGTYQMNITGQDMSNLNVARFPLDVMGVDADGNPVTPIHGDYSDGSISGTFFYEGPGAGPAGPGGPTVAEGMVRLEADYNGDGITDETWTTPTDMHSDFMFNGLHPGRYTITIDIATLPPGVYPLGDDDGVDTPNVVRRPLTMCTRSMNCIFTYWADASPLLGALER